ncbi:hypothetical protein VTH06DRAFT_7557 [Thermothelomyces fergusii]
MAVTNAVSDLVQSVGELLSSVLGAAYAIVHSFLAGVFNIVAGFFAFLGGIGKFMTDNAVVIGVLAAAIFAYTRFFRAPQAAGRKPAVTNGKKTN